MSVIASMIAMIGKKKKSTATPTYPNEVHQTDILGAWTFRRGLSDYNNSYGRQTPQTAKVVNNKLFVLGQMGTLMVSDDAVAFTKVVSLNNAGWPGVAIADIDYSPEQNLYVVVGNGYVAKSHDLLEWEMTAAPTFGVENSLTSDFIHVFWKGGMWTIVPSGKVKTIQTMNFSSFSVSGYTLVYGCIQAHKTTAGLRFMGNYGLTEVNDAGDVTGKGGWSPSVWPLYRFAGEGAKWFGVNNANGIQADTGVTQWSTLGTMTKFTNLFIVDNAYFFTTSDGKIYKETNAVNPLSPTIYNLAATQFGANPILAIVKFKGNYIAIGLGRAIASPDLTNWGDLVDFSNTDVSFANASVRQLNSNGTELLAVGDFSSMSKSLDSIDWEFKGGIRSLLGPISSIKEMARSGNTILLAPKSSNWLKSTDGGENWSVHAEPVIATGTPCRFLLKMATKFVCFSTDNFEPKDVKSNDLSATTWASSLGPYNRLWGSVGSPSNGKRAIAGAAYGGQILTVMTNGGYVLTSGNEGASYDYAGNMIGAGPLCGKWLGQGTAFGDGDHVYGFSAGTYGWWKLGAGLRTNASLNAVAAWEAADITALGYANGYFYFGGSKGRIARTPSLTSPTWEVMALPTAWQKQPVRDIVVHGTLLVACGDGGKLATAQL